MPAIDRHRNSNNIGTPGPGSNVDGRVRYRWRCKILPIIKQICNGKMFGARGRGRTGTAQKRRDFKSRVSTNFTTRASAKARSLQSHEWLLNQSSNRIYISASLTRIRPSCIQLATNFPSAVCMVPRVYPRDPLAAGLSTE